jgi:CO/xanthine dehydrogenase Mo-binding subunit
MILRPDVNNAIPITPAEVEQKEEYAIVGHSVPHDSSQAKVTGQAKFSTDVQFHQMLYGKLLLSEQPHARLVGVDVSEALALPGVKAVITGEDTPERRYGPFLRDRPILARDWVRFIGEPIAAVAAISESIAARAASLIKVHYEDLPAVFEVNEALKADAPILHPNLKDYEETHPYIRYGNTCMEARISQGDVETGFYNADHIIEATYKTHGHHQAYIEPHACTAVYDHTGRLTVWTATQQLSWSHADLARVLDIPMTQVRMIPTYMGGAFGGKLNIFLEPICALLTRATGLPVQITLTREEEFLVQHGRAPFTIHLRTGVLEDGTITAHEADILVDAGAYVDQAIGIATKAAFSTQGCYFIPNCKVHTRAVYTNNVDWGCMRGYGTLQMNFALESHLDAIAKALQIEPVHLREKNLCTEGDEIISGQRLRSVHIDRTMQLALEQSGYWEKRRQRHPYRGIGLANVVKTSGFLSSSATIRCNEDGTVSVMTSITDLGTGAHTVLRQITAEVLGLPIAQVFVSAQDSDNSPFDIGSQASRTIYDTGNAVRLAAESVRDQLVRLAAEHFTCSTEAVAFSGGRAVLLDKPDNFLNFIDLVGISIYARGGPLVGHGSWIGSRPLDNPVGEGFFEGAYPSFGFATQIAEVEIDPETGKVTVLSFTTSQDVGKALNPAAVEGQIEGAVVQGIGFCLLEEMLLKDGKVLNPSFVDYRIPTILDTVEMNVSLVEEMDPTGPFGAKGAGEAPIVGVAPAIANAVFDALGIQIKELPITPEKLYFAIREHWEK